MRFKMRIVSIAFVAMLFILSSVSLALGGDESCGVTKTDIVKGLIAYAKGSGSIDSGQVYTLVKTYSGYEDCNSEDTADAILAVSTIDDDVVPECPDGTLLSHCSSDDPKYCQNGVLVDRCDICCDSGMCNSMGECILNYADGLTDCRDYGDGFFCGNWDDFVGTCNSMGRLLLAVDGCAEEYSQTQYCIQCINETNFAGIEDIVDISDIIPDEVSGMIPEDISGSIPDVGDINISGSIPGGVSDEIDISDIIPGGISDDVDISGAIPGGVSDEIDISDIIPGGIPDNVDVSGSIPGGVSDEIDISDIIPGGISDDVDVSGAIPDISDIIPDISDVMSGNSSGCTSCGDNCIVCVETSGLGDSDWEDIIEGMMGASAASSGCTSCGVGCVECDDVLSGIEGMDGIDIEDMTAGVSSDDGFGIEDIISSIFSGFGSFLGFR